MGKNRLFDNSSFRLPLPAPFDDPQYSGGKDYGTSVYNTMSGVKKATMHAPTMRAVLAYAKLAAATSAGDDLTDLGALGVQGNTFHLAEYCSAGKTDCVVFNRTTGKFIAGRFDGATPTPKPFTLSDPAYSGSALLFCLIPILDEEKEFHDTMAEFIRQLEAGWPDMAKAEELGLLLCDNAYRRIENSKNIGPNGIAVTIPQTGNIVPLTQMALDQGTYGPTSAIYGGFTVLLSKGTGVTAYGPVISNEDFVGKYPLSQRTLTAREQFMVPKLPDYYIIPQEVVQVCEHAKETTGTPQPMRNFMFRGDAGTGKTMGAQAIAAGLNLPYTLMTCNANTENSDLIGQFIPDTRGASESSLADDELPKMSDIMMHPPSVFNQLTGIYDETKTEDDVLQKLVEISVSRLLQKEEHSGQRIRYVDSPLLEAIRYGYVCELQEPSCIANPGVLVGLNALLDDCQTITLATGEQVHRHPDTVIIVTTNSDYAGCRDMNQSVISRMKLLFDIEAPDPDTMVKRALNLTGFQDEQMAMKMCLVVRDIADRCRQTMIRDGSCGMREFISWIQSTMVTKDPYASALFTVISSASADPDNRAELINTCLETQFSRTF